MRVSRAYPLATVSYSDANCPGPRVWCARPCATLRCLMPGQLDLSKYLDDEHTRDRGDGEIGSPQRSVKERLHVVGSVYAPGDLVCVTGTVLLSSADIVEGGERGGYTLSLSLPRSRFDHVLHFGVPNAAHGSDAGRDERRAWSLTKG